MKLYYVDQRKVFPFLQPVEVWDEQGNVRYRLKSKCTVGLQLYLLTPYDEEAASLRQKISLGTKFIVNVNDNVAGSHWNSSAMGVLNTDQP